jgi:hypothetical protein
MAVSGNPAIETVWLRWVPGVCLQKLPLKKNQKKKKIEHLRKGNLLKIRHVRVFSTTVF